MTANPKWSEIEDALLKEPMVNGKRQTASDHLDIVARVFELKKNALLKDIKDSLFRKCVASVHTIEFQKRGLLHIHILIFFHHHDMVMMAIPNMPDLTIAAFLKSMVIIMTIIMLSHTIHISQPNSNVISMWKSVLQWMQSKVYL